MTVSLRLISGNRFQTLAVKIHENPRMCCFSCLGQRLLSMFSGVDDLDLRGKEEEILQTQEKLLERMKGGK